MSTKKTAHRNRKPSEQAQNKGEHEIENGGEEHENERQEGADERECRHTDEPKHDSQKNPNYTTTRHRNTYQHEQRTMKKEKGHTEEA